MFVLLRPQGRLAVINSDGAVGQRISKTLATQSHQVRHRLHVLNNEMRVYRFDGHKSVCMRQVWPRTYLKLRVLVQRVALAAEHAQAKIAGANQ